jgi:hypothetical protein
MILLADNLYNYQYYLHIIIDNCINIDNSYRYLGYGCYKSHHLGMHNGATNILLNVWLQFQSTNYGVGILFVDNCDIAALVTFTILTPCNQ